MYTKLFSRLFLLFTLTALLFGSTANTYAQEGDDIDPFQHKFTHLSLDAVQNSKSERTSLEDRMPAWAQVNEAPDLKFEHISVEDGLPHSEVFQTLQDYQGFIWFGTDGGGLARYDGYNFKVYKNDLSDEKSLSRDKVWALFEDSQKILWIGLTGDTGLDRYDRENDSFINYPVGPDNSEVIPPPG
ncbi:MAG: hypothetical protein GY755_17670 [Chloroflexi bacterium]|nr:hypothetical protein [Chloroflexota bacterium]